jgi:hypothetical protein
LDGHILWLKITENEVKANYERDNAPNPLQYYVKDYAHYSSLHYPELTMIPLRYTRPAFTVPSPPSSEVPRIYKCGLCDLSFNTEGELNKHVTSQH